MRNKSIMNPKFGNLPDVRVNRSMFNRSHGWKGTFDSGYLIPIYVDTALPGDTFSADLTAVTRLLSPLKRPMMDNIYMDFFFFSCPYRLLFDNFKKMMGEQVDPGDSISYTLPQMTIPGGGITEASMGHYFGLPLGVATMASPNSLHFRMYNKTYNEWFRDQNVQDSVTVDTGDGPDTLSNYVLLKRGVRYNYFNQMIPSPQKGDAVELPIGSTAPVMGDGKVPRMTDGTAEFGWYTTAAASATHWSDAHDQVSVGDIETPSGYPATNYKGVGFSQTSGRGGLVADLAGATAATINEWREANQLQAYLEIDAVSGTRYPEWIYGHFGVSSPDQRQQRVEFLGGGTLPITVSTVEQQSESGTTKQGFLTGHAHGQRGGVRWSASFTEHTCLLGLVNVRCDLTYQQRLDRMWTEQTREDLYVPVLAHLGEQVVLTQELFCDGSGTDDDVLGYVPRWDHLRSKVSIVTGALSSYAATPLDMYHLAQDYGVTAPVLNDTYMTDDPPIARIQAVTSEPDWIMDLNIDLKCVRPIPVRAIPGMGKHF